MANQISARGLLNYFAISLIAIVISGCDFDSLIPGSQQRFVDQGFKTAIALIELHKIRNGKYPELLDELEYVGDWDPIYRQFVIYKRTGFGYVLNVKTTEPSALEYPEGFWNGLGLLDTNVGGFKKKNGSVGSISDQPTQY